MSERILSGEDYRTSLRIGGSHVPLQYGLQERHTRSTGRRPLAATVEAVLLTALLFHRHFQSWLLQVEEVGHTVGPLFRLVQSSPS